MLLTPSLASAGRCRASVPCGMLKLVHRKNHGHLRSGPSKRQTFHATLPLASPEETNCFWTDGWGSSITRRPRRTSSARMINAA